MISILLLANCDAGNSKTVDGVMVRLPGKHYISEGFELQIAESSDHKISAILMGAKGEILFKDAVGANIYERWFYFWDDQKALWFWSTDKGAHCWARDGQGQYHRKTLGMSDAAKFPNAYWDALPSVIQDQWSSSRQK